MGVGVACTWPCCVCGCGEAECVRMWEWGWEVRVSVLCLIATDRLALPGAISIIQNDAAQWLLGFGGRVGSWLGFERTEVGARARTLERARSARTSRSWTNRAVASGPCHAR